MMEENKAKKKRKNNEKNTSEKKDDSNLLVQALSEPLIKFDWEIFKLVELYIVDFAW